MNALANKHILLGVTGGIAAYKTPELVRRLREAGAEVRVALTEAAAAFVTPLTLQAVSGRPVHRELLRQKILQNTPVLHHFASPRGAIRSYGRVIDTGWSQ